MQDQESKTAAMLEAVQREPGEPCVLDCYFCRRCGKIVADETQFPQHLHGDQDRSPQPPRGLVPFTITVLASADGAQTQASAQPKAEGKQKPARTARYKAGPQASDRDLAITVGLASYEQEGGVKEERAPNKRNPAPQQGDGQPGAQAGRGAGAARRR